MIRFRTKVMFQARGQILAKTQLLGTPSVWARNGIGPKVTIRPPKTSL